MEDVAGCSDRNLFFRTVNGAAESSLAGSLFACFCGAFYSTSLGPLSVIPCGTHSLGGDDSDPRFE